MFDTFSRHYEELKELSAKQGTKTDAGSLVRWFVALFDALLKSCVFTKCNEYCVQNQLSPTAVLCGYVDKSQEALSVSPASTLHNSELSPLIHRGS